nr:immunoglobulin heavy chain junction region [Macaca mulatta]MOX02302.1 immunoglobulin heavy chain junction region [Macaca mulatta]MOX04511.1 immunoglobulin heavy chain junction region [Macaca mulatta]MOX06370.1 immunoglobulin heavy chain junction region [Macaca mulatta]MOX06377.1 immunoglobulin heavy chain junction region [Macaca mulatta]
CATTTRPNYLASEYLEFW